MKNDLSKRAMKGKMPRTTDGPRFVPVCQCSSWARGLLARILSAESLFCFIFLRKDCGQRGEGF